MIDLVPPKTWEDVEQALRNKMPDADERQIKKLIGMTQKYGRSCEEAIEIINTKFQPPTKEEIEKSENQAFWSFMCILFGIISLVVFPPLAIGFWIAAYFQWLKATRP
jgi:hypothetical protein